MKSPRHWALQQYYFQILCSFSNVEMKSPRHWALQRLGFQSEDFLHSRNEKPETLGIATSCCLFDSQNIISRNEKPETLGIATKSANTPR